MICNVMHFWRHQTIK